LDNGEAPVPDRTDCMCCADVIQLGPALFRVPGPLSLTPFGPYGPMLDLGTTIEAKIQEDGSYRYIGTRESLKVWTRILCPVQEGCLQSDPVVTILRRLTEEEECSWEWCAGNLTIQGAVSGEEIVPDGRVATLLAALQSEVTPP
jgi:hypothetical protein